MIEAVVGEFKKDAYPRWLSLRGGVRQCPFGFGGLFKCWQCQAGNQLIELVFEVASLIRRIKPKGAGLDAWDG